MSRDLGRDDPHEAGRAENPRVGPDGYRTDAHALVIGIDAYEDPGIRDLQCAVSDARAMHAALVDPKLGRIPPRNAVLLLNDQATEREIRAALRDDLVRRAGQADTVVIYFAGHGAPVVSNRGGSRDGMDKFLLPHDAEASRIRASAIRMDLFQEVFDDIRARQVLVFLDCCYSGGASGRGIEPPGPLLRAPGMLSEEFLTSLGAEGRLVVTACAPNERAMELPELGHGLFTHYLLKGLGGAADRDGDGIVSMDELYEYVSRHVEEEAQRRAGRMSPMRSGEVRGRVYLTQYETATQRRVRQLLTAAQEASRGPTPEAASAWGALLREAPDHPAALQGLEECRAREEAERRALAAEAERARLVARQHRLRYLRGEQQLTAGEYQVARTLVDAPMARLSPEERFIQTFLHDLLDGACDLSHFREAVAGTAFASSAAVEARPQVEVGQTPSASEVAASVPQLPESAPKVELEPSKATVNQSNVKVRLGSDRLIPLVQSTEKGSSGHAGHRRRHLRRPPNWTLLRGTSASPGTSQVAWLSSLHARLWRLFRRSPGC